MANLLFNKTMKRTIAFLMTLLLAQTACQFLAEPSARQDGAEKVLVSEGGSLQNPAWSPDGKILLFTRFQHGYNQGPADILLLHLFSAGESKILITDGNDNINLPGSSWNPITNQIVFSSTRDPHDEIYVIDANRESGDERQVTSRAGQVAYEPSLSPDGTWVVFESHPLDVEEKGRIVKYKLDGSQTYINLTGPDGDARQPNWSPAGDLILYQALANGQWDVWVMNTDGTDPHQVTRGPGNKTDASFSPDGNWIVYSYEDPIEDIANLYVISTQGGQPIRVTNFEGYDGAPSWSPNGNWIAFESSASPDPEETGTTLWLIMAPDLRRSVKSKYDRSGVFLFPGYQYIWGERLA